MVRILVGKTTEVMPGQMKKVLVNENEVVVINICLLYTYPSPRDLSTSRMPSSA